jgi:hypothetical protein
MEDGFEVYKLRVIVNGDLPDFRLFSVYLWGEDHSYDSDGDSYNPASRTWTALYMGSREVSENFEMVQTEEHSAIFEVTSSDEFMVNRAALFLAKETNGQIAGPDDLLHSYHFLTDKLGDFDLRQALERAEKSVWRKSTLDNPYPNLN